MTITADKPFSPDAVAKVSESVRPFYSVIAYPLDGDPITLDVLDLSVTFDEAWAPHITARITCAVPEDQAVIDALDGRKGPRVTIELGYDLDSQRRETQVVADLMISSRELSLDEGDASMRLTAYSDERRVQEQIMLGDEKLNKSGIEPFVASVLTSTHLIHDMSTATDFIPSYGAAQLTELEAPERGDNAWDLIAEAQQRTNTWIYCKDGRNWYIVPRPELAHTPDYTLETGANGTVLSASMNTDRSNFYNFVHLDYTFTSKTAVKGAAAGVPQTVTGTAYISYGDFNVATVGTNIYYEKIEMKVTKAQANAAAKSKLSRLLSKGHTYDVTALALYSMRPGQTVRVKLFGADQNLLVQQVTFSPARGVMDLVLRKPERNEIV